MEFKRSLPYGVTINPVNNGGYVVEIGCQTLAYGEKEAVKMVSDLTEYIYNPDKVMEKYNNSGKNNHNSVPEPRYDDETQADVPLTPEVPSLAENTRTR